MSLDERMRAGTRAAAGSRPIDTTAAWEEVQMQAQRAHTRRNVVLVAAAAAAVVAGVVWGPGIVDSLSNSRDPVPVDQPTDEAVVDDGTGEAGAQPNRGATVQPGTYTYDNGPFPITLTTSTVTLDGSYGGDAYRIIQGDPYGGIEFDFPATAADLTQRIAGQDAATDGRAAEDLLFAGPIDFPTDIDAWLEGAVSLDVVDQGTLSRPDGEAAWWDLQVSDPSATCFADETIADVPPCVVLWPYVDDQTDNQIGMWIVEPARLYAIETDTGPLMALASMRGGPQGQLTDWLAVTDEIVASITLE